MCSRLRAVLQLHRTFAESLEGIPPASRRRALERLRDVAHTHTGAEHVSPAKAESQVVSGCWDKLLDTIAHTSDARRWHDILDFVSQAVGSIDDEEASQAAAQMALAFLDLGPQAPPPEESSVAPTRSPLSREAIEGVIKSLAHEQELPPLDMVEELLRAGSEVFRNESNIVEVAAPAIIVGDIHGQWRDLNERILQLGGPIGCVDSETGEAVNYLFLGDYVDRGDASVKTLMFLAASKLLFPRNVFLIRGNHESRKTNTCYGFLSECHARYPLADTVGGTVSGGNTCPPSSMLAMALRAPFNCQPHPIWSMANELFDHLPLAAVVHTGIFCVHGGLSPKATTLASIVAINRHCDVANSGPLADMTWSDPFEGPGWSLNHRGCGQLFGQDVTEAFLAENEMRMICRAHQCVRSGYLWTHGTKLLTLFSAANYCGQGNDGAIMKVDGSGAVSFLTFRSALSWDDDELDELDIPDTIASPTGQVQPGAPPLPEKKPPEEYFSNSQGDAEVM